MLKSLLIFINMNMMVRVREIERAKIKKTGLSPHGSIISQDGVVEDVERCVSFLKDRDGYPGSVLVLSLFVNIQESGL